MDTSIAALLVALDRWVLYGAMLLASGSALAILVLPLQLQARTSASVLGRISASAAAMAYVLAIGCGGADMLGSTSSLWSGEAWTTGASTSLLLSAAVGIAAMTAFALGFTGVRAALWLGVALAVASFLVTGHGVSLEPRWLVDLAFAVHLLGVAFWLGALWPLAVTVKVQEPAAAASAVKRFSRFAAIAVAAIIASGIVVSWVQLQSFAALIHSGYGLRLSAKLILVAALLAVAFYNKRTLTPALAANDTTAARHLRTHIIAELALFAAILAAAVALTLVASPVELAG